MKFFQKRWVAITLCILMILTALAIGRAKESRSREPAAMDAPVQSWESYSRYVVDKTGLLSEETIRKISERNAESDASYSSVCGVGLLDSVSGSSMEEAAFDWRDDLGLGDNDYFLLLDWNSGDAEAAARKLQEFTEKGVCKVSGNFGNFKLE